MAGNAPFMGCFSGLLPSEAGEVPPPALSEADGSYGDGVMSQESRAHDPSVGDYADTSPASLGRRTEELAPMEEHPERWLQKRARQAGGLPAGASVVLSHRGICVQGEGTGS